MTCCDLTHSIFCLLVSLSCCFLHEFVSIVQHFMYKMLNHHCMKIGMHNILICRLNVLVFFFKLVSVAIDDILAKNDSNFFANLKMRILVMPKSTCRI